jgi:hypothetical protein
LLIGLSSNIFDELACGSDQFFFNWDFRSVLDELCDINSSLNVFVTVESFAESRLEHVARVWGALVLKKLCWELSTPIPLNFSEVPMKVLKI